MRHPFIYGTFMGLFLLAWEILLTERGSYDPEPSAVPTAMQAGFYLLFIGFLVGGLWKMKKDHHNVLPFKEAFLTGLNMSVMAAVVSAAALWFYLSDMNPEYLTRMAESAAEVGKETGQTIDIDPGQIALMRTIWQFISATFSGLLLTLPVSFFLRSKETKPA